MEAYIPYEIDLEVKATDKEKVSFMLFLLRSLVGKLPSGNVEQFPEEFKKFFKISNYEGSAKVVN